MTREDADEAASCGARGLATASQRADVSLEGSEPVRSQSDYAKGPAHLVEAFDSTMFAAKWTKRRGASILGLIVGRVHNSTMEGNELFRWLALAEGPLRSNAETALDAFKAGFWGEMHEKELIETHKMDRKVEPLFGPNFFWSAAHLCQSYLCRPPLYVPVQLTSTLPQSHAGERSEVSRSAWSAAF